MRTLRHRFTFLFENLGHGLYFSWKHLKYVNEKKEGYMNKFFVAIYLLTAVPSFDAFPSNNCNLKDISLQGIKPYFEVTSSEVSHLASAIIPGKDLANVVVERRGCCSWHGGVCGCSEGGRAVCCDGQLSPTCGCDWPWLNHWTRNRI